MQTDKNERLPCYHFIIFLSAEINNFINICKTFRITGLLLLWCLVSLEFSVCYKSLRRDLLLLLNPPPTALLFPIDYYHSVIRSSICWHVNTAALTIHELRHSRDEDVLPLSQLLCCEQPK